MTCWHEIWLRLIHRFLFPEICHIYTLLLSVLQLDIGLSDVTIGLAALQMYRGGETVVRKSGEILREQIKDDLGIWLGTSVWKLLQHRDTNRLH